MFARFHAFEVNKEQNTFLLNWETVEEISSQHYLVERSNDGRTFTPIATIPSKAADAASFYTYRDKAPLQGKNFYRIRQVDKNGGTSFSPIRSIEHTPPTQLQIVQRNHEIALYYNCEGKKSYTVFDIKGNLLKLGTMNNNKCVIAGLSPGLYIINLQTSTNTINTQVAVTN
ncbi:MAG TPA: T9SS type A sorting domain-containing protein [Flavisolibacter sp.]|nr:T9SS type A sorting domain-containing protein [Flavisolibacter sp.]